MGLLERRDTACAGKPFVESKNTVRNMMADARRSRDEARTMAKTYDSNRARMTTAPSDYRIVPRQPPPTPALQPAGQDGADSLEAIPSVAGCALGLALDAVVSAVAEGVAMVSNS